MSREMLKPSATVEVNEFYLDLLGKYWYAFDAGSAEEIAAQCETHVHHDDESSDHPEAKSLPASDREVVCLLDVHAFVRQPWQEGGSLLDLFQYVTRDKNTKRMTVEPFLYKVAPPEAMVRMLQATVQACSCLGMIVRLGKSMQKHFGPDSA